MKVKKFMVLPNYEIENALDCITQYSLHFDPNEYHGCYYETFDQYFGSECDERLLIGTKLPSKAKLIEIFNEDIKANVASLAEEVVDGFIEAFEEAQEIVEGRIGSVEREEKEKQESLIAKELLQETLTKEQKLALAKAFNITV